MEPSWINWVLGVGVAVVSWFASRFFDDLKRRQNRTDDSLDSKVSGLERELAAIKERVARIEERTSRLREIENKLDQVLMRGSGQRPQQQAESANA